MTSAIRGGPLTKSMTRDAEGHREYKISHLVVADWDDGPEKVFNTPGLPLTGSLWNFDNDMDVWAFCRPQLSINLYKEKQGDGITDREGESATKRRLWKVDNTFATRQSKRCQDTPIEDPLLEPQKVSGSFEKLQFDSGYGYEDVAAAQAGGARTFPLKTPSHEPLRGISVDDNRPTVRISQNVASLGLATFSEMVDTLNDSTLWGLATRKIKLDNVSWERNLTGSCDFYYTRTFEFSIEFNTFDRIEPAYGKMELSDPFADSDDLNNFNRQQDGKGNLREGFIAEGGLRASSIDDAVKVPVIYYTESNFLLLGIPTSLGV